MKARHQFWVQSEHPLPSLWVIVDQQTEQPAFLRVTESDQIHRLGPFVYSTLPEALEASKHPAFMPKSLVETMKFRPVKITGENLISAIIRGFDGADPDVLSLDEALVPLTASGAKWVDSTLGQDRWANTFPKGGDKERLQKVLDLLGERLGSKMVLRDTDEVPEETSTGNPARAKALIRQHVHVRVTPEMDGRCNPDGTLGADSTFWVHTVGMDRFDRPELEVRQIPAWFVSYAVATIKGWAAYSIDNEIKVGERLKDEGEIPVFVRASASVDPYWFGRNLCLTFKVERVLFQSEGSGVMPGPGDTLH